MKASNSCCLSDSELAGCGTSLLASRSDEWLTVSLLSHFSGFSVGRLGFLVNQRTRIGISTLGLRPPRN